MTLFFSMLVPGILAAVAITGTVKKVDVYQGLADGAMEGMKILLRILPALVGLLTAVHMLRASGLLDWLAQALAPVLEMTLTIPVNVAWMAIAFSVFIGVVFGRYPANKASKLRPIEALHYEG